VGTEDQYLWESQMAESEKWMAAPWRYAPVEGASHWAMHDHPQQVNQLLLEWLAPV
jgi:pimeloyl-ACP methyl ester carboxylesterase